MWLVTMPVAAAQLVLLTAAEDGSLVGDEGFASALPLAASGPGEPFVTAAGVLGERLALLCMLLCLLVLPLLHKRHAPPLSWPTSEAACNTLHRRLQASRSSGAASTRCT